MEVNLIRQDAECLKTSVVEEISMADYIFHKLLLLLLNHFSRVQLCATP